VCVCERERECTRVRVRVCVGIRLFHKSFFISIGQFRRSCFICIRLFHRSLLISADLIWHFPHTLARFYRALYAKLGAWELRASSKHAMLLNLLFKAMKMDPKAPRVFAFLKRLLQVTHMYTSLSMSLFTYIGLFSCLFSFWKRLASSPFWNVFCR